MRHELPEHESRADLSALDPDRDAGAADRFVAGVMARVAARPAPRALPADPLVGIWSLVRSPAIAAGIIIAATIGAVGVRMNRGEPPPQTIAQAMGVPAEFLDGPPPLAPGDSR